VETITRLLVECLVLPNFSWMEICSPRSGAGREHRAYFGNVFNKGTRSGAVMSNSRLALCLFRFAQAFPSALAVSRQGAPASALYPGGAALAHSLAGKAEIPAPVAGAVAAA
jgi:hypothetical protein